MEDFNNIQWYTDQLKEAKRQKEILLHAMENVARRDFPNYELIDDIANRIASITSSIKYWESQIEEKTKVGTTNGN